MRRAVARHLGEALDPDTVQLAGRGVGREARQQLPEVAARLGVATLRRSGDRDEEVGALEPDRKVGGAEEEPSTIRSSFMYGVPLSCSAPK